MRLVIVESPYAGNVSRHVLYARLAIRDCLLRGESPIASHLLFTQDGILRDDVPAERLLGMAAGRAWYRAADAVVFYYDLGWSEGMRIAKLEAERVKQMGELSIEERRLDLDKLGLGLLARQDLGITPCQKNPFCMFWEDHRGSCVAER